MLSAFEFGRRYKRAFYVSPGMMASGNFGTTTPPKRKKKKKLPNAQDEKEPDQKSAAYLFGALVKKAQNPSTTSGTLSLANPSQTPAPSTTVSSSGQGFGAPVPKPPATPQPPQNPNTWGNYLTNTNSGVMKDVGDYFTHTLPQTFMPWTDAYQTADARFKNLPADQMLRRGAQASAAVGAAAGATALALPAVAPGLASMPLFGTGGATAGTAAGGAVAGSQTPAGQNMLQRGSQMANQAADIYNSKIHPMLDKVKYKPEDVLSDAGAALTGHFDKVKGPNWSASPSLGSTVIGGPSFPRPKQVWENVYGSNPGMLPGGGKAITNMYHAGMQ